MKLFADGLCLAPAFARPPLDNGILGVMGDNMGEGEAEPSELVDNTPKFI